LFISRNRGTPRYTTLRVALFFLAAGIWLGGYFIGNQVVTGVAIFVAILGVILGMLGRERAAPLDEDDFGQDDEMTK
jgi:hypothetical protein